MSVHLLETKQGSVKSQCYTALLSRSVLKEAKLSCRWQVYQKSFALRFWLFRDYRNFTEQKLIAGWFLTTSKRSESSTFINSDSSFFSLRKFRFFPYRGVIMFISTSVFLLLETARVAFPHSQFFFTHFILSDLMSEMCHSLHPFFKLYSQ